MPVQVLILRGPGTNCNNETEHAFRLAGAQIDQLHINRVVESPKVLNDYQIVCIPGGFSFGDDLGAGVLFANILREKLGDELRAFRDRDRLILGICNGFQILLKTGLLVEPTQSADKSSPPQVPVTLAFNKQGRFECRWCMSRSCRHSHVFCTLMKFGKCRWHTQKDNCLASSRQLTGWFATPRWPPSMSMRMVGRASFRSIPTVQWVTLLA